MLLDRYRQLLTAYVDGELNNRQRRQIVRLLRRSPEARLLLQQLKADARALRHLPCPPLAGDFTPPILHTISQRRLTPGPRRLAKISKPTAWVAPLGSWAAAAAVLLILGAASYLYFALALTQSTKPDIARTEPASPLSSSDTIPAESPLPRPDRPSTPSDKPSLPQLDAPVAVQATEGVKPHDNNPRTVGADKPVLPSKEESALTDRLEMFQLDRVPDMLPLIIKLSDLEKVAPRINLIDELKKDSYFRLELPCPNGTKALERVQKAAKTMHYSLIIEKQAQERIKLKRPANYVLYLENITPDELTQLVRQIGSEDRNIAKNKPVESQLDRLVLSRMTAQHRKELSSLLGIDPTTNDPAGTDPHKPLADANSRSLGKTLTGQGGEPRPASGQPAPTPAEQLVLVLAYNPVRPAPASDEIKQFLDRRMPSRSGTLRVLIVLRS